MQRVFFKMTLLLPPRCVVLTLKKYLDGSGQHQHEGNRITRQSVGTDDNSLNENSYIFIVCSGLDLPKICSIFKLCVSYHGWGKFSDLWSSGYWNINKTFASTLPPGRNSPRDYYHHPQAEGNSSFSPSTIFLKSDLSDQHKEEGIYTALHIIRSQIHPYHSRQKGPSTS